jgi:hypothetical protein
VHATLDVILEWCGNILKMPEVRHGAPEPRCYVFGNRIDAVARWSSWTTHRVLTPEPMPISAAIAAKSRLLKSLRALSWRVCRVLET